jgi:hypothetical protein
MAPRTGHARPLSARRGREVTAGVPPLLAPAGAGPLAPW